MIDEEVREPAILKIGTRRLSTGAAVLSAAKAIDVVWIHSNDGDEMPKDLARALGEAPVMSGVRGLKVEEVDLGRPALEAICTSSVLGQLEALALWDCDWASGLGSEIFIRMAASANLRTLKELEVNCVGFDADGIGALAQLPALERLLLHQCSIGEDGVDALLSSGLFARLKGLGVSDSDLTADVLEQLRKPTVVREQPSWLRLLGGP